MSGGDIIPAELVLNWKCAQRRAVVNATEAGCLIAEGTEDLREL